MGRASKYSWEIKRSFGQLNRDDATLLADSQPLDHLAVVVKPLPLEILEESPALANKLEQPATGMMVLDMAFQMFGEIIDPVAEKRDLNLRGTGVFFMKSKVLNDGPLCLRG